MDEHVPPAKKKQMSGRRDLLPFVVSTIFMDISYLDSYIHRQIKLLKRFEK